MTAPPPKPRPIRAIVLAVLLGSGLPFGLFFTLNLLRPDLYQVMLGHGFGQLVVWGMLLLSQVATALYVASAVVPFRRRALPRIFAIAGFLLCTLPALFVILFGPIVYAFMYGAAG